MARPATKEDLISMAEDGYEKLNLLISSLTTDELSIPLQRDRKSVV